MHENVAHFKEKAHPRGSSRQYKSNTFLLQRWDKNWITLRSQLMKYKAFHFTYKFVKLIIIEIDTRRFNLSNKYERWRLPFAIWENRERERTLRNHKKNGNEEENEIVKLSKIIITKVQFNGNYNTLIITTFELMTTNSESQEYKSQW